MVTQAEFESATFGFGGRTSLRDFNHFGDLDGGRRLATAIVGRFENSLRTGLRLSAMPTAPAWTDHSSDPWATRLDQRRGTPDLGSWLGPDLRTA